MSIDTVIDEPEWPDILRALQVQVQDRIHTALPGIVKGYDPTLQVAKIQLAVQLHGVNVPPLVDVPVCHPGGAAGVLHIPLLPGDTVMVLFAEQDFSRWWSTGSVSPPAFFRRHGFYAVAIPGLRRSSAAAPVSGGHVTLQTSTHIRLGDDSASAFVALASLVTAELNTLKSAISSAPVVAGDGGASFKAALVSALSSWPSSVAATKVKAS